MRWAKAPGNDLATVRAYTGAALDYVRETSRPMILEFDTYRYRGHSMSDPAKYRAKEEVNKMRAEHDPIEQVRLRLMEAKSLSEDDLKQIDKEIKAIVNEAAEFAQSSEEPDASELWTDVLAEVEA